MTDEPCTRPVLVGMNNPHGTDPRYALYPLPERATGWRIWQMIREQDPDVSMSDYRDAFDRRNLLTGPWSDARAAPAAGALRRDVAGRQVVLLGAKLRDLFLTSRTPCGRDTLPSTDDDRATYVHWLPHPSGLNPWYNDTANRAVAGRLLLRLMRGERGLLEL